MGISINDMNLRVTDYARVSTEHEEQKKSLRNQVLIFSFICGNIVVVSKNDFGETYVNRENFAAEIN